MAIQISDKYLSEKARKALNSSVNKSQFLRDAIEFYVNTIDPSNNDSFSLHGKLLGDIEELKTMIINIAANGNAIIPKAISDSDSQTVKVGDNLITKESAITNDADNDKDTHSKTIVHDTNAEKLANITFKEGENTLHSKDIVEEEEIPNCYED